MSLSPLEVNTLEGELSLLILQGSWLPEDPVIEVSGETASAVIRGGDCRTRYRVSITRVYSGEQEDAVSGCQCRGPGQGCLREPRTGVVR